MSVEAEDAMSFFNQEETRGETYVMEEWRGIQVGSFFNITIVRVGYRVGNRKHDIGISAG